MDQTNFSSEMIAFSNGLEYDDSSVQVVDHALIESARQGEKDAFERLFIGTYRYVFSVCRKYLKQDQDICDAIQDTYVSMLSGLKNLREIDSFYPWLGRIAQNSAFAVWNKLHPGISFEDYVPEAGELDSEADEDIAVTADVTAALKELPAEQAELLVRLYYDKFTVTELAKMQGVPRTTVSNRVKAAKKNLKEILKLRGIEKPIYSSELIALISNAIRHAIGTNLLSMAVAQEILNNITNSKNKKDAAVIIGIARHQRNAAALKIAGILVLGSVLLAMIVILLVMLFSRWWFDTSHEGDSDTTQPVTSYGESLVESQGIAKEDEAEDTFSGLASFGTNDTVTLPNGTVQLPNGTVQLPNGTVQLPNGTVSTPNGTVPSSHVTTSVPLPPVGGNSSSEQSSSSSSTIESTPSQPPESTQGNIAITENFGTLVENSDLDIAVSNGKLYAVANGDLVAVKSSGGAPEVLISGFGTFYGASGNSLNIYDNKVYWINKNTSGKFVLNRCNLNGTNHYSVIFTQFDCARLTKMVVASDGVYFYAGTAKPYESQDSGVVYKADHNFQIKSQLANVADYTLVGNKLYYLYGRNNCGYLYSADRSTLNNTTAISNGFLSNAELYALGKYLVLDPYSPYIGAEYMPGDVIRVVDSAGNELAGKVWHDAKRVDVTDVSEYGGGLITYTVSGTPMLYNFTTKQQQTITTDKGTIYVGYRYYISENRLYRSNIDGASSQRIY